jgi:hypothetical protein
MSFNFGGVPSRNDQEDKCNQRFGHFTVVTPATDKNGPFDIFREKKPNEVVGESTNIGVIYPLRGGIKCLQEMYAQQLRRLPTAYFSEIGAQVISRNNKLKLTEVVFPNHVLAIPSADDRLAGVTRHVYNTASLGVDINSGKLVLAIHSYGEDAGGGLQRKTQIFNEDDFGLNGSWNNFLSQEAVGLITNGNPVQTITNDLIRQAILDNRIPKPDNWIDRSGNSVNRIFVPKWDNEFYFDQVITRRSVQPTDANLDKIFAAISLMTGNKFLQTF